MARGACTCDMEGWAAATPACTSQMAVVASKLAVASWRPPGAQLQHRMVRACASSKMALHTHSSLPGHFLVQSLTVLSPLQLARVSPASDSCPS